MITQKLSTLLVLAKCNSKQCAITTYPQNVTVSRIAKFREQLEFSYATDEKEYKVFFALWWFLITTCLNPQV
jgi:hypothetical protein